MNDRLKKIRKSLGLTQTEFAERMGKKMRTIQDYEAGLRNIDSTMAKLLQYEFAVNLEWLQTGEGGMFLQEDLQSGEHAIPVYDVAASAGYGAWVNGEAVTGYYKMPDSLIRKQWKASPKNTVMLFVKGDSMNPLLQDGDLVAIDKSRTEAKKGLYVCRVDNELYIKNVSFHNDVVILSSENPDYEPIAASYKDFALIGKVIWYGRSM